eukprot:CAMPEP_0202375154 /NCGR_PEP_ID=MMETSP1127-20130417/5868_1 /ASSEMBLY_ACC=CAM_ASM_000462 /TAXON_ID=3047 /ORGANISM="Dunaliella tertiolecta, Strain CCMP1320" /LENGTH=35 /DNA_ID= /DNA_START= /DNA_END= /DNA_ORIENTATION=
MRSRVDSHMQQLLVAESQVASAVALNQNTWATSLA